MSLSDYWEIFYAEKLPKLSETKQTNYKTAHDRLKPLMMKDITKLTVSDLQGIVSSTTKTFYPARDMKTLLIKLFTMAAADGLVSKDLPSFIELPPQKETHQDAFTRDEIDRIAAVWENGGNLTAGCILLMIGTGMMPGELLGLQRRMIDLENMSIVGAGKKTKQRKTQSIVVPPYAIPILEQLLSSTDQEELFPNYYYEKFSKEYYQVLSEASVRALTPYACRHTTATMLSSDASVAPALVSRVMRHSSRMTERYTHIDDTAAHDAVSKIPAPKL